MSFTQDVLSSLINWFGEGVPIDDHHCFALAWANFGERRDPIEYNNQEGFEKVFEALKGIDDACNTSALIVIPWTWPLYCKCYKDKSPQELMAFLAPIYNNFNRPQPKVYLEKANVVQAKTWVTSSNKASNDLITDGNLVNGFEHPIVVIFNAKGQFEHNLAMRSTGIVLVVDIPYKPWSRKCFHPSGIPDDDHYN